MAKTNKNILGDQRGKIGKVVGRVVEGEQMYSSAPGPRGSEGSTKQKEHRACFSAITRMGKPLKGAIKIGMKVSASKKHLQSPFNLFVNRNLKHTAYNAETGLATPDYEAIILSEGNIPFVTFAEPTFTEPQNVTITYNGNSDCPGALEEDIIYVVAYCPDLIQSAMGTSVRSAETMTITVPKTWVGKEVHLWGFAKSSVTRLTEIENYGLELVPDACSISSYVGSGVIV